MCNIKLCFVYVLGRILKGYGGYVDPNMYMSMSNDA